MILNRDSFKNLDMTNYIFISNLKVHMHTVTKNPKPKTFVGD
jgi:hypothetical protein